MSENNKFLAFQKEEITQALISRFEKVVAHLPEHLAVKTQYKSFTFNELNQRANQLAHYILDAQHGSGKPAAIFCSHDHTPIIAALAILKAGKAYVPLNPTGPDTRIKQILNSCGADIVIADTSHEARISSICKGLGIEVINQDPIPSDAQDDNPGILIADDELMAVIYTSGSMGIPKGVMHGQETILHCVWLQTEALGLNYTDRHALIAHISYVSGTTDIFRTILNGGCLYPIDFYAVGLPGLSELLSREEITVYHSVPTIFRRLLEDIDSDTQYPSVRLVHLGGEPVFSGDVRALRKHFSGDCVLLNNLGSTEVPTYRRYLVNAKTEIGEENLPVGFPVVDKHVIILDENGEEASPGTPGEIVIESQYMARGYLGDATLTASHFKPLPGPTTPGRFFSGDLGVIDEQGKMKFLGRKDFQVKVLGNRVELGEVEANLLAYEGVHQAVALVHKRGAENVLTAYLIPSKGSSLELKDLRAFMMEKLPIYMVPKVFHIMQEFPYTQTNKVARNLLPGLEAIEEKEHHRLLPRNELEEKLARLWKESLKLDQVGVRENFFALGGDSMAAVTLFLSIEEAFGIKLPLSILLSAGDIEKQALILSNTQYVVDWSPVVPVQTHGSQPPLFCLFGKGGNPLTFRQFSEYFGDDQPVYFLQSRGLSGRETPLNVVEDIAADFINEIKKIWPKGPYRFCGASFGGIVGFEMAQQLNRKGDEVDLLVLFDTYGPGYPSYQPGVTKLRLRISKTMYFVQKHIRSFWRADWQGKRNYLRYYRDFFPQEIKRKGDELVQNFKRRRAEQKLPEELKKVMHSNVAASARYTPTAYEGRVLLIRASQQPFGVIENAALGWEKVQISEFAIEEVEAHHGSILFEPSVRQVVEKMKPYLNK